MIYITHWLIFTGIFTVLAVILGTVFGYKRARAGKVVRGINRFLKKWRMLSAALLAILAIILICDCSALLHWTLGLMILDSFQRGFLAICIVIASFLLSWALIFFGLNFMFICTQYFFEQYLPKRAAAKAQAKAEAETRKVKANVLRDHNGRRRDRLNAACAAQEQQNAIEALNGNTSAPA